MGEVNDAPNLEFWTSDSSHFERMIDLTLMGFFIIDEKEKFTLGKTKMLEAVHLSDNINHLADGSISLRFD